MAHSEQNGLAEMLTVVGRLEAALRSLLKGEFSSLIIGFNDEHAPNYLTAEQYRDECGMYDGGQGRIEWVSEAEREKAIRENSVWTLQWYPDTPSGFYCVGASSLAAIVEHLSVEKP